MTTCKAWCGKKYGDDSVPVVSYMRGRRWGNDTAYCSQACLDAATANPKRDEGPVIDGVAFRNMRITSGDTAKPATTAPVERRLADGWQTIATDLRKSWECTQGRCRARATYRGQVGRGACEACAPSMGVFAEEPVAVVAHHAENVTTKWNAPAGWKQFKADSWNLLDGTWQTDPRAPAVERWYVGMDYGIDRGPRDAVVIIDECASFTEKGWKRITAAMAPKPCARCTHTHQGPCDGRSPFGGYSCPCGHEKAEKAAKATRAVGEYLGDTPAGHAHVAAHCQNYNQILGHTVTLLANLAREKVPPRREVKQVARYADGVNLDWWEL